MLLLGGFNLNKEDIKMDCRSTILANNKLIFLMIHTDGDYNYKSQIGWHEWLNPLRYQFTLRLPIGRYGKNIFTFNKDGKLGLKWSNFNYRNGISCKLGLHFIPRGLWEHDGSCTKCKKIAVKPWNHRPKRNDTH